MQCPICKSSSTYALSKDGRPYFKCSQCEFLFHPKDEKDEGKSCSSFYGRRYWDMERAEALRRENEDGFLRALELLYLSNIQVENILDFGCGLGVTVQLLRDKLDLNAVGVDISADFEKTEYLHKCDLKDLQSIYPSGHFDAIYSVEVFEHVRNPRQILCELKALLKPGGKILLNTATQECIHNYDPEMTYIDPIRRGHVSIYSLKSLETLASYIGYTAEFMADRKYAIVLSPQNATSLFPLPDNVERTRKLGEWFPMLFREYMRLVFMEQDYQAKGRSIIQLAHELELLRKKPFASLAKRLSRKAKGIGRLLLGMKRQN